MESLIPVLNAIDTFMWGPPLITLLVGTGIYLTVRLHLLQVFRLPMALRLIFSAKNDGHGDVSSFKALCVALAATVGTGNIVGVATAVKVGGPGAIFWMWVAAFFGMVTKYAEIVLAMKYRIKDENGVYHGGPMYYIENGIGKGWKWLAVIFCLLGGLASFGIGNIAQSSEISGALSDLFHLSPLVSGILIAVVVALVTLGGIKRIGKVTALLVPFMSVFYIVAGIVIILMRITHIPAAFAQIFAGAFSFKSVGGGLFGYTIMMAMKQGFARGVFSNEAGLGSAPIAHAASSTEEPCEQAIWGVFEVFIDTIVICSITAFAVLLSGVLDVEGGLSAFTSKGAAAAAAFNSILPGTLGGKIIELSLLFFALSTILSWAYYGENCWGYLTNNNKVVVLLYKVIFALVCIVGAVGSGTLMWDIADTLNGLMAIPNLIALLLLSGVVAKLTREYFSKNMLKK